MSESFNSKSILVTGGTGSFGKRFVKYVLDNFNPERLIIFSRDEFKQFEMQQNFQHSSIRFFLGDVRDEERLQRAMKGVDFVVHAAAMKQVEASEYNPTECIKTNIVGAQNIINAALNNNVQKVVALSTDKAASPLNLYGASKLVSDKLFVAANNVVGKNQTQFSIVRYGNVIGSRGSVIPFFKRLVNDGKKILPVTHEDMTRFCISLDEGVQFVAKSFDRMVGGEIFVPKLPSIKIIDLAKIMSESNDVEIVGIRPGEKIHEIMIPLDESRLTIEYDDFYLIKPSIDIFSLKGDYSSNHMNESGALLKDDFEYSSGTNLTFLNEDEIIKILNNKKLYE